MTYAIVQKTLQLGGGIVGGVAGVPGVDQPCGLDPVATSNPPKSKTCPRRKVKIAPGSFTINIYSRVL